jgi:thiosulfate dehydrogenase
MGDRSRALVSRPFLVAVFLSLAATGCAEDLTISAADHGRDLYNSKALSSSNLNNYTCANCHTLVPEEGGVLRTGGPLAGSTRRLSLWGGQENDLLRSINACRSYFMVAPAPLEADDPDAEALYAFLKSLEPGDPEPIPFTVVRMIEPIPRGDADAGQVGYARTCGYCHGSMHEGLGRLSARVPILPEDTIDEHINYTPRDLRLVFIEKVRHGLFYGYGGDMPPFSTEVLSNSELADILEALGIYGE